jgi:putative restriction endonuclease
MSKNAPIKEQFRNYLEAQSTHRTGKASSYVRALDLLSEMLSAEPMGFGDCMDIWCVHDISRLQNLYHFAAEQKRLGRNSLWNIAGIPKSYLRDGYCSAALREFQNFLLESAHIEKLIWTYRNHKCGADNLAKELNKELAYPKALLEGIGFQEGKETVRQIKTRVNQQAFRQIVLDVYGNTCCITGLDIPEVNRASHIIPWSVCKETRMDPRNGLCLSATYDAAFDRYLISLDEDFRVIISQEIRDYFTSSAVRAHFIKRQGQRINLPKSFQPLQSYIENHRGRGHF